MHFPFPPDTVHFNPRSREGSDAISPTSKTKHTISIHAPAKGATEAAWRLRMCQTYFNPRSREGSDGRQDG